MQMKIRIILFLFIILLYGCSNNPLTEDTAPDTTDKQFSVLRTKSAIEQSPSNQAKKYINNQNDFNEMYAVNTDSVIIIGVDPKHRERFQLKDFRESIEKDLHDKINSRKLEISTDKKIVLELKQLEERIQSDNISEKELEKELDRIIKLSKDQNLEHK